MALYRGEVTDNKDPMQRNRVRVFIWGIHKEKDENLPWAEVIGDVTDPLHQGKGKKSKEFPIGCTVWVDFESNDINCPVVLGVFVGHGGDDMSMASPANSDWMMGSESSGWGAIAGGAIGSLLGGIAGQKAGELIGSTIEDGISNNDGKSYSIEDFINSIEGSIR